MRIFDMALELAPAYRLNIIEPTSVLSKIWIDSSQLFDNHIPKLLQRESIANSFDGQSQFFVVLDRIGCVL